MKLSPGIRRTGVPEGFRRVLASTDEDSAKSLGSGADGD